MEIAEAGVARVRVDHAVERAESDPGLLSEVDLPVVGGDQQRGVSRQHVADRTDEPIGRRELSGVEGPLQPERVRDLVDAGVVRVDERRAARDQCADVLDQHRSGGPPMEVGAAQVHAGEPAATELRLGDHGDLAVAEGGVTLHVGRFRRPLAVLLLPTDGVQHRMIDPDAESRDPVTTRWEAGGDRRERRRSRGRDHRGDRPPFECRELREHRRVTGAGLPTEPVEHQEDDRAALRQPAPAATRPAGPRAPPAPHSSRWGPNSRVSAVPPSSRYAWNARERAWTRDHVPVKVSTRGDYAARALLSLALHGSDRPTSVKEIAERTGLPQPYLEQILLAVKGAGLVRSKRGVGGGYVLARDPTEITLADILAAVDGPLTTLMGEHDHCEGHCVLQEVWVGVSDETRRIFERFTLADLVERTRLGHPDVVVDS